MERAEEQREKHEPVQIESTVEVGQQVQSREEEKPLLLGVVDTRKSQCLTKGRMQNVGGSESSEVTQRARANLES